MSLEKQNRYLNQGRALFSLTLILCFRMLGLFMIYPVFALYAPSFQYATPTLIGFALGIYGLTQALLQLPFSIISDYFGRKPIIIMGLSLFALGSIICALSANIYWLILGRAIQGGGAIGSTIMACAADFTGLEDRTKAMALLGISIGFSFLLAMIIGPLLNSWIQLSGIFWITALFATLGIGITYFVPHSKKYISSPKQKFSTLKHLFISKELISLNCSILFLHAILTASFAAIPLCINQWAHSSQWQVYLEVLTASLILIMPMMIWTEKKHLPKFAICASIGAIVLSEFIFYYFTSIKWANLFALITFFAGFTWLEAILPSQLSKIVSVEQRGTMMGIFSTCQFLGIFLGGLIAGVIRTHLAMEDIFLGCAVLSLIWFGYSLSMKKPAQLKTQILRIQKKLDISMAERLSQQLNSIAGVFEAYVSIEDSIAYLKVDNKMFDQAALKEAMFLL